MKGKFLNDYDARSVIVHFQVQGQRPLPGRLPSRSRVTRREHAKEARLSRQLVAEPKPINYLWVLRRLWLVGVGVHPTSAEHGSATVPSGVRSHQQGCSP